MEIIQALQTFMCFSVCATITVAFHLHYFQTTTTQYYQSKTSRNVTLTLTAPASARWLARRAAGALLLGDRRAEGHLELAGRRVVRAHVPREREWPHRAPKSPPFGRRRGSFVRSALAVSRPRLRFRSIPSKPRVRAYACPTCSRSRAPTSAHRGGRGAPRACTSHRPTGTSPRATPSTPRDLQSSPLRRTGDTGQTVDLVGADT